MAVKLYVAALCALLAALGCGGTVTVQKAGCVDDEGCLGSEHCIAGLCQAATAPTCSADADCDASQGELCVDGTCSSAPTSAPDSCTETRDCPVTDFCNTATNECEALHAGFCRLDGQCPDTAPLCDTPSPNQAGRCVECRADADCDGGVCGQGGVCVGDGATVDCPDHASLVPGSTTVCQCDPGYIPDVTTATCVPQQVSDPGTGTPPPDTSTCVPNASPVPGIPGQCRCDTGYEPSTDGTACVSTGGTTPPPPPPPPPPPDGGGGGGGGGGGDPGTDDSSCGPNAIPVFFLCVCLPGFVVADSGYGCVLDAGGGGGGGGGDDCPPNSSLESDGYCYCDPGYVVDSSGTQCVYEGGGSDECAELGYYGDGMYCDDFCPQPDPDCY